MEKGTQIRYEYPAVQENHNVPWTSASILDYPNGLFVTFNLLACSFDCCCRPPVQHLVATPRWCARDDPKCHRRRRGMASRSTWLTPASNGDHHYEQEG